MTNATRDELVAVAVAKVAEGASVEAAVDAAIAERGCRPYPWMRGKIVAATKRALAA